MEPLVHTHYVKSWAERTPDADAILAPGQKRLTYGELWRTIERVAQKLRAMGIKRNDRVAMVVPKSPEGVVLHLAISACATYVPLNPAAREAELDYAFSVLNFQCVVVQAGAEEPAASLARARGVKIAVMTPSAEGLGNFALTGEDVIAWPAQVDFAEEDDIAFILQTSGTTARPKMIPHTHRALCAGMLWYGKEHGLDQSYRSLNAMPLFHVYGVAMSVLPVLVGGNVVCTHSFDAHEFFSWLDEFRLTSISLVPTMHQAVAAAAAAHQDELSRHCVTSLYTGSAPLHTKVIAELERIFCAPVIEIYGMTEICGLVLGNPKSGVRKPGSVGIPGYHEVDLTDEDGRSVAAGEEGEIVVRGPGVMSGYLDNPEANAAVFRDGWLRTGDRAYRDADGYYFITGRTKELINRGGEKISPREVDDALMEHPAVKYAVAFAVPHKTLGEDLAAAVLLADGAAATSTDLRAYAAERLAAHKVPRRIVFVDEIPRNATGKPLRVGLAARLGMEAAQTAYAPPATPLEVALATIWSELLRVERIGIHDDFFEIGGDSLLSAQMLDRIKTTTGRSIPSDALFSGATIANLAQVFLQCNDDLELQRIVAAQSSGSRPPLFLMHGDLVGGGVYSVQLARLLGPDQPLYVVNPHLLDENDHLPAVSEMAADNVKLLLDSYPDGPYYLLGFCNGALVTYEMGRQLRAMGKDVAMLAMIDAPLPSAKMRALTQRFQNVFAAGEIPPELLATGPELDDAGRRRIEKLKAYVRVLADYQVQRYDGHVELIWTAEWRKLDPNNASRGWCDWVSGWNAQSVPGNHLECVTKYVDSLAAALSNAIQNAPARAAAAAV